MNKKIYLSAQERDQISISTQGGFDLISRIWPDLHTFKMLLLLHDLLQLILLLPPLQLLLTLTSHTISLFVQKLRRFKGSNSSTKC